ncbi:MAG: guanylate kinase, partial [Oscillospiraceae bacterium]|nr:guanylate kinase [Oscillospiraceae bacterium]
MQKKHDGLLVVVSGPSGVGKSTIIHAVMEKLGNAWFSVSATTRAIRPGETDGVDYHFISREAFLQTLEEGGFLEHNSYSGNDNLYGTPMAPILSHLQAGEHVFLDIDVNGARQVRQRYPAAILVFIAPPSMQALEQRLRARGTNTPEQIARRLATAAIELPQADFYDYIVINEHKQTA